MKHAQPTPSQQAEAWIAVAKAFLLGIREFRSSCGRTYENNPHSPRSIAYDHGREIAHRATFRHWDN